MLPRKNFENLHAAMAILVLLNNFPSSKFYLNFLTLLLSGSSRSRFHTNEKFSPKCAF